MNIEITPEIKEAKQRFGIIGNSPALMAAVGRALQVAPIDLSVLINGASGTGKEYVAHRRLSMPTAHASTASTSP